MKDIISLILSVVEQAEKIDGLLGKDKKMYVIDMVKNITVVNFGSEYYHTKVEPLVPALIELFVSISKGEISIDINKINARCFGFCS